MPPRSYPLSPPETAALTRLVLGFCIGRGSLCLVTRSISLQCYQPRAHEDYSFYQWRRLCQFLPRVHQPRLHENVTGKLIENPEESDDAAQWRMRTSSKHFRVAFTLLYPHGSGRGIQLTSDALSLLGAEAIASLWADRGRLVQGRGQPHVQGRLNLSRYDWGSAGCIAQWIQSLTGACSQIASNPRSKRSPMLFFDHSSIARLLGQLGDTWMAQAGCLRPKFALPAADEFREQLMRERLSSLPLNAPPVALPQTGGDPLETMATVTLPSLRIKRTRRRAPAAIPTPPGAAPDAAGPDCDSRRDTA